MNGGGSSKVQWPFALNFLGSESVLWVMKLVHSIEVLNVNQNLTHGMVRATRTTSQGRRYTAALVVTVTARAVELETTRLLEAEREERAAAAALAVLLAETGMTVEAARAEHEAAIQPWFDALFANERKLQEGRTGLARSLSPSERERAKAMTIAQGIPDPYVSQTHAILELDDARARNAHVVKRLTERALKVGDQSVLSWHKDLANAQKALGGGSAQALRPEGMTVEIRTDITITEP